MLRDTQEDTGLGNRNPDLVDLKNLSGKSLTRNTPSISSSRLLDSQHGRAAETQSEAGLRSVSDFSSPGRHTGEGFQSEVQKKPIPVTWMCAHGTVCTSWTKKKETVPKYQLWTVTVDPKWQLKRSCV